MMPIGKDQLVGATLTETTDGTTVIVVLSLKAR